jgi:hypothetical protein
MTLLDHRRALRSGIAILLAAGVIAGPASGEIRTSHYRNRDMSDTGSATDPQVAAMVLRYDTTAGTLNVRLIFFHALANPDSTSSLRQAFAQIELGDAYGGDNGASGCSRGKDGLFIEAALGNNDPPSLGSDPFNALNVPAAKFFTSDRAELDVTAQAPRLAHLNLICASITAFNNATNGTAFLSGPFLLDGFTVFDGNTTSSADTDLEDQARFVNNDLSGGKPPLFFRGSAFRCRKTAPDAFRCGGARQMPSITGKPVLQIAGTQRFQLQHRYGADRLFWIHNERASLSWRKCPAVLHPAKRLVGRHCSVAVRWHTGALWQAFVAPKKHQATRLATRRAP